MVSKLASEHVKVVLSGDGGDEIFGGYDKYVVEGRERRLDRIPRLLKSVAGRIGATMPYGMPGRRFLRHAALSGTPRYLDASTLFDADERSSVFSAGAAEELDRHEYWENDVPALARPGDWLSPLQYRDLNQYLPLDILTKVDRMTMAHSLEARPPLLDHELVEFAATVPASMRLRGQTTKYLFKRAMTGVLPDDVLTRRKHGFAVPLGRWLRRDLSAYVRDILLSDTCRQRGVFDTAHVGRLIELNRRGRDLDLQLWTLLSFELWCRRFLDTRALGAPARHVCASATPERSRGAASWPPEPTRAAS
jgi:asparagine synthase (glutamine-hydrolysing)